MSRNGGVRLVPFVRLSVVRHVTMVVAASTGNVAAAVGPDSIGSALVDVL
jgi:hypothetical protein